MFTCRTCLASKSYYVTWPTVKFCNCLLNLNGDDSSYLLLMDGKDTNYYMRSIMTLVKILGSLVKPKSHIQTLCLYEKFFSIWISTFPIPYQLFITIFKILWRGLRLIFLNIFKILWGKLILMISTSFFFSPFSSVYQKIANVL